MTERSFDAVLFDWVGTVAHYSSVERRFEIALAEIGRGPGDAPIRAAEWRAAKARPC